MQGYQEGGLTTDLTKSLAVLYWCFASRLGSIVSEVGECFSYEAPVLQGVELFSVGLDLTSERSLLMSWSAGWQHSWKTFRLDVGTRRVKLIQLIRAFDGIG